MNVANNLNIDQFMHSQAQICSEEKSLAPNGIWTVVLWWPAAWGLPIQSTPPLLLDQISIILNFLYLFFNHPSTQTIIGLSEEFVK